MIFETDKKESFKSTLKRIIFNFFPAYRRTGGRVCFMSDDGKEIHVKLGLSLSTRNYVGTVFGGSIFGSTDPIFMLQLLQILGNKYVVWDKGAAIKFKKPISNTVYARFLLDDTLLAEIKKQVQENQKTVFWLKTHFQDAQGNIYAEIEREIFVANKDYYKNRQLNRS